MRAPYLIGRTLKETANTRVHDIRILYIDIAFIVYVALYKRLPRIVSKIATYTRANTECTCVHLRTYV